MSVTTEDTPQAAPGAVAPVAEPVACRACGAAMEPGQDWCLTCGTAAPGRLGGRPGWRAVNAVALITFFLVAGAIAAGYAALSGDATTKAGRQATVGAAPVPGQVAQLPDAPPAPATTATTPPVVKAPTAPVTPKVPAVPVTPVTPVTPIVPAAPTDSSTDGASGNSSSDGTSTGDGTTTTTGKGEPATPALKAIEIASDDVTAYDPSSRIRKSGDPGNAADGNKATAWSLTTPDDGYPMQAGLLVDLGSPKTVKQLDLGTTTPGGRVEVYGAAGSALPPDILDTRWEHVASRTKVDQTSIAGNTPKDRTEQIKLLQGGGRFRYVLVWFTEPPQAGPTVRVTEVGLSG